MSKWAAVYGGMLAAAAFANATAASVTDARVQAEITYLLQSIEGSGCEFYRNGSWYDGKHARSHLQVKYDYLVARGAIHTAEEFIDKESASISRWRRWQGNLCDAPEDGGRSLSRSDWSTILWLTMRSRAVAHRVIAAICPVLVLSPGRSGDRR